MLAALVLLATACEVAPSTPFDFDGDGRADYAWIDAQGNWRTITDHGAVIWTSPEPDDPFVPGDYDGDGRLEPAAIDDDGNWVTAGPAGTFAFPPPAWPDGVPHNYGNLVLPVPGRYDGGARDVPAWYRDLDATWFIQGQDPIQFGNGPTTPSSSLSGAAADQDVPVPADYDGDGITDLAVYNPHTGSYRIRSSVDDTVSDRILLSTTDDRFILPVPGDYDGVGHAQAAVWGSQTGWVVEGRADPDPFGTDASGRPSGAFAMPVPADYDADGRVDFSVMWDDGAWSVFHSWMPVSIAPVWNSGNVPVEITVARWWTIARVTYIGYCLNVAPSC